MPTAVESPEASHATGTQSHGTGADHIKQFEKKINTMKSAFAGLRTDASAGLLLGYIHRPGWTTLPESIFFESMVDSIIAQTQQLAQLHKQLMAGAALVGRE